MPINPETIVSSTHDSELYAAAKIVIAELEIKEGYNEVKRKLTDPQRIANKKFYAKHREQVRLKGKAYYDANREAIIAKAKEQRALVKTLVPDLRLRINKLNNPKPPKAPKEPKEPKAPKVKVLRIRKLQVVAKPDITLEQIAILDKEILDKTYHVKNLKDQLKKYARYLEAVASAELTQKNNMELILNMEVSDMSDQFILTDKI